MRYVIKDGKIIESFSIDAPFDTKTDAEEALNMEKLEVIKNEIEQVKATRNLETQDLYNKALREFSTMMDSKLDVIGEMIAKLENSRDFTAENDDILVWTRVDFNTIIDEKNEFQRELLSDYLLNTHCIVVNFQHSTIQQFLGRCIIIDEDLNVYDQDGGNFVSKNNSSKDETKKTILKYMEKTGIYPTVVSVDRYGNITLVKF